MKKNNYLIIYVIFYNILNFSIITSVATLILNHFYLDIISIIISFIVAAFFYLVAFYFYFLYSRLKSMYLKHKKNTFFHELIIEIIAPIIVFSIFGFTLYSADLSLNKIIILNVITTLVILSYNLLEKRILKRINLAN